MHSSTLRRPAIAVALAASLLAPSTALAETNQNITAQAASAEVCSDKPLIDRGHVDIKATGGKTDLGIVLKDDTSTTPGVKERRLDSVVFGVRDNARKTREGAFADPFYNFIGPEGSPFYLLPELQNPDILWPGYNTETIDYRTIDGTVDLHITIADGPKDGHLALFHADSPLLLNTKDGDTTIDIDHRTHVHTNWIFTQPGTYTLDVWYTARTKDGKELKSEVQKATFAVGNDAVTKATDCTAPGPGQSSTLSSGSSLDPGATAGIALAAVFGVGLLAFLASNIPAITGWISNLTDR